MFVRNLYIFLLLIISILLHAQDGTTISGRVIDDVSGAPIGKVNIRIMDTYSGISSSDDGYFTQTLDNLPVTLVFSHISYHTKSYTFTPDMDSLVVRLVPKITLLKETEITAKYRFSPEDDNISVMDFEFIDKNILILLFNHTKEQHELILTDPFFDTLALSRGFDKKYGQQHLFQDCLGACHVYDKTVARQIVIRDSLISLKHTTSLKKFQKTLDDCLFETPNHVVFKQEFDTYYHQYYALHKETGAKTSILTANEIKKARALDERIMYIIAHPNVYHNIPASLRFEKEIMYKPAYQVLKMIGDTIYYFDHSSSSIDTYDSTLNYISSIPIDYHKRGKWEEEIFIDPIQHKAYTSFRYWDKYVLIEIDLVNGETKFGMTIPFIFPHKIAVNDGFLYVINKQIAASWKEKSLYRIRL